MRLIVWQKAVNLFELVWRLAYVELTLDFKLRSQSTEAAPSVSANIAEGYGRRSIKEYTQFLYIALGSLAQTVTRAVGLLQRKQIGKKRFEEFDCSITRWRIALSGWSKNSKISSMMAIGLRALTKTPLTISRLPDP
jgi:four helix bundle protein